MKSSFYLRHKKTWFLFIGVICCLALAPTPVAAKTRALVLTDLEKQWLIDHKYEIRIAHAPEWPPMDFTGKDGEHKGMVADYINLIEKKLDISFREVSANTWDEVIALAKTRGIDVISAGQVTPERKKYMSWSTPYLILETTIIVQKSRKGRLTLENMRGMTIGVPKGYAVGEFIREKHPYLTVVDVKTTLDGMQKVSFGEIDAMVTEVPNALYIIENENITNLRLAGNTGFTLRHGMGIRNDWPVFYGIIQKTLASITDKEKKAIRSKWITLETTRFYQSKTFWYTLVGVALSTLFLIGFILLWNRTLKVQVMQRTEELRFNEKGLEALLELNERAHTSLKEIIEFSFKKMLKLTQSTFGYLAFDDQEGFIYIVNSTGKDFSENYISKKMVKGLDKETIGFWGEAVRQEKPVISNNYYASNPEQRGIPKEYGGVVRYMNVPIFHQGKVVIIAGMGNKQIDYTPSDLRQLNLLAQGMWRLIQRRKAEQTLLKSEKRFRDLVENSPNGIAIIQDGKIVYKNTKQIELTGDLQLFESNSYKLIHQDDYEKTKEFYDQLKKGVLIQTELDFRFYNSLDQDDPQNMKWVGIIATPIEYQDRDAILAITIDLTESKELERLLTVQDKMASLGHVSAGIAHEIRNPLSGININLRTIEKSYKKPAKSEKVEQSIQAIRSASKKIESVIRRVMNFAKPSEPRFDLIDINKPIIEAIELSNYTLKKNNVNLELSLGDSLPKCFAEPQLIEEVVLNLINNAADEIKCVKPEKIIRISSYENNNKVCVSVEDNGPGIKRDLREKIFEPFFTTKEYSTGIGLSICHRIITDHKGVLRVGISELGGANFVIEIPFSNHLN